MRRLSLCFVTLLASASAMGCDAPPGEEHSTDDVAEAESAWSSPTCDDTFSSQPGPDPFLDSIPQSCFELPSGGYEAQLPFKYWGARSLVFSGTADLEATRAMLKPMGLKPLDLFGVNKAAVGFVAIDYEGTSSGPIKPVYFFIWTTGKLESPSCYGPGGEPLADPTCVPGMFFTDHYFTNTERALWAGIDLWKIPKKLATTETSFLGDVKSARVLREGKEWIRLKWNRSAHPELVDTPFQSALWGQAPPFVLNSNLSVYAGTQLANPSVSDPAMAPLVPHAPANGDEVQWDPSTALGKTLAKLDFNPTRDGGVWLHGTSYRGVMYDRRISHTGPVIPFGPVTPVPAPAP